MKPAEIRELTTDDLNDKLTEARTELFNLRFQMAKVVKKDIARICTELRAREIRAAAEATA